ncbi:hypothetical protein MMC10_002174 [Thelotrema lepadinum]|nr:hypothetical protein [Thelotrema lepadinum]
MLPIIQFDSSTILQRQDDNARILSRYKVEAGPLQKPNLVDMVTENTTISPNLLYKHYLECEDKPDSSERINEETPCSSVADFCFPSARDLLLSHDNVPSTSTLQTTPKTMTDSFAGNTIPQAVRMSVSPLWPTECISSSLSPLEGTFMDAQSQKSSDDPDALNSKKPMAIYIPPMSKNELSLSKTDQVLQDSRGGESSTTEFIKAKNIPRKRKSLPVNDANREQHIMEPISKKPRLILRLNPMKAEKSTHTPLSEDYRQHS